MNSGRFFGLHFKRGFTLIELLVVISIIGLLSSVVMVNLSKARGKARDARRISDLAQIKNAFILHYDKYENWIGTGSGCGSGGGGNGWFNHDYDGTGVLKTIGECLRDEGFTPIEMIDPTGGRTPILQMGLLI